jgi:hypothetical protein
MDKRSLFERERERSWRDCIKMIAKEAFLARLKVLETERVHKKGKVGFKASQLDADGLPLSSDGAQGYVATGRHEPSSGALGTTMKAKNNNEPAAAGPAPDAASATNSSAASQTPAHDKEMARKFLAGLDPNASRFTFQFFSDFGADWRRFSKALCTSCGDGTGVERGVRRRRRRVGMEFRVER